MLHAGQQTGEVVVRTAVIKRGLAYKVGLLLAEIDHLGIILVGGGLTQSRLSMVYLWILSKTLSSDTSEAAAAAWPWV